MTKWYVFLGHSVDPSISFWDGGMSVSLAANRGSSCSLTRAMDGRIVRCGISSSCQSDATSEIVKTFWSRVYLM